MPATRASSRSCHHTPFRPGKQERTADIIIISSDDERPRPSRKPNKTKHKDKPTVPLGEVIEIVSDDENVPPPTCGDTTTRALQTKLLALEKENERLKRDNEDIQAVLLQARAEAEDRIRQDDKIKRRIDAAQFEDHVTCEICVFKMWKPYILPDCGHVFCESCLQDWFSTALAKHMQVHPHYDVNRPYPPQLRDIFHHPHLFGQGITAQMNQQAPQPQYTCPVCRQRVHNKPVEDFALKAIVKLVAEAQGEPYPQKQLTRGHHAPSNSDPWSGFFPRF